MSLFAHKRDPKTYIHQKTPAKETCINEKRPVKEIYRKKIYVTIHTYEAGY